MLRRKLLGLVALASIASGATGALAAETVKIALIDPMSGPFANVGSNLLKTFQYHAEKASKENPAYKFEVEVFDNKASPQETVTLLNAAIDKGFRYVTQGLGSAPAAAIVDALNKYNERNPGKEVIYLNHSATDPDLTGSKCSFWHVRFDSDTATKAYAVVSYLKKSPATKKVYLINQNYSHGQQFSKYAKEYLAKLRPDIEIVGDDLHPMGQVKDFSPYVAKMKAAGADTVLTANWGPDVSLLIKAAKDAGLGVTFYASWAMGVGNAAAIGSAGEGKVKTAYSNNPNLSGDMGATIKEFKARFNEDYAMPQVYQIFKLFPAALKKAGSTDPVKVAKALEGLTAPSFNEPITMRAADHQIQEGLYIATWHKLDKKNTYNVENTGYTWVVDEFLKPDALARPTTCQMKRPN